MLYIFDGNGKPISRSQTLRGIRRHCGKHIAESVSIWEKASGGGVLNINFAETGFSCEFADFTVLCRSLRYWRNLYGVPLWIDGYDSGTVSCGNHKLVYRSA